MSDDNLNFCCCMWLSFTVIMNDMGMVNSFTLFHLKRTILSLNKEKSVILKMDNDIITVIQR